ncbi:MULTISPECIES: pyrophosphatase PpaX [Paenibacillus]|uniref:pyrophosphatase PpaX n=1 Tax=Paenibacillus TaxID=44249 RepID=UPI0022B8BC10|nr:pyrophosphatase PpaX [Paenibacillus caseinilyticus]MCZ8522179.1 pyrophosphatase PpaX [Paenibacillus caseinilyticus]
MIQTVLFDLDGTILDTNELIIQSFLHTFEGITAEPLTRHHIIPNMGRPLVEQMVFFSGREQVDDLVAKYRLYNLNRHDELVQEFPKVRETLAKLHAAGIQMGVVTSKIRKTTEMGLKLTGMYDYFGSIVTVEDVEKAKPDPEGIQRALQELGADPATALMVGDSHYDIEAAHNAGLPSVGVAWSMKGVDYLLQYAPTHIIHDIEDLLGIVGMEEKKA